MYNEIDENMIGTCSELFFAPIDASFSDDSPLLPSGFRIVPIDPPLVSICNPITQILGKIARRHAAPLPMFGRVT
jgi:hypothetical protein